MFPTSAVFGLVIFCTLFFLVDEEARMVWAGIPPRVTFDCGLGSYRTSVSLKLLNTKILADYDTWSKTHIYKCEMTSLIDLSTSGVTSSGDFTPI